MARMRKCRICKNAYYSSDMLSIDYAYASWQYVCFDCIKRTIAGWDDWQSKLKAAQERRKAREAAEREQ